MITAARICEKGHVVLNQDKFCTQCGAVVLDNSPKFSSRFALSTPLGLLPCGFRDSTFFV